MNELMETMLAEAQPLPDEGPRLLLHSIAPNIAATTINYGARADAIAGEAGSWDELLTDVQNLQAEDGARVDITGVDLSQARLRDDEYALQLVVGGESYPLRAWALGQLCSAIGAPLRYLATLPVRTALKCIAWGLRTKPIEGRRTLRMAGNQVRAIVSSRYQVCDDLQILGMVETALDRAGIRDDVQVEQLTMGRRTGVRLSVGKPVTEGDPSTGLGARAGITIGNGELGNGSKKCALSLYVPWCTNGCSVELGDVRFRSTHLAKADEGEFVDVLLELFAQVPTLTGLTEQAARDAFDVYELQGRVNALGLTRGQRRSVLRQTLAEAFGLYPTVDTVDHAALVQATEVEQALAQARTDDEQRAAADEVYELLGEQGINAWNLCQGVTATARDSHSETTREQLEELGGRILAEYLD